MAFHDEPIAALPEWRPRVILPPLTTPRRHRSGSKPKIERETLTAIHDFRRGRRPPISVP
ncbi:hypothetical protein K9U39_11830 [Rhodoblastus acidophilus]|nr:hypothetical protein [Rhodoblastus acidophilus]